MQALSATPQGLDPKRREEKYVNDYTSQCTIIIMRKTHTERGCVASCNGQKWSHAIILTELAHWLFFFLNWGKRPLLLLRISKVRHFQSPQMYLNLFLCVVTTVNPVSQIVLHCGTMVEGNTFWPLRTNLLLILRMNVLFPQSCPTLWPLGL